ncbi:ATP-binding protein [Kiloniella antarctica]|uniref:histidine kinase n=1 Tax=Kiloniella antarctica TaxID=1550907 RepID=A0ABW5BJ50_9PROT
MVFKAVGRYPQIVVAIVILGVIGLFIVGSKHYLERTRQALAFETAKAFEISITTLHNLYSKEVVPRAEAGGIELTDDLETSTDKIPFPATMTMTYGEELERVSAGMTTSMYSAYPFPGRASRKLDAFQLAALNFLKENPEDHFYRFAKVANRDVVRYSRGISMNQDCLECHNTAGIGRKWVVGDFRGVREVIINLPRADALEEEMTGFAILLAILAVIFGSIVMLPTVNILQSSSKDNKTLVEELTKKNAVLENADLAKSRLLKGVGHDLKTPLNAIIGFSDTMNNEIFGKIDNAKYKDYAQSIHSSGLHLLRMIEQLLNTGAIQDTGWSYEEEALSVNPLLASIEPVLRSATEMAGIKFVMQPLHSDITLMGDGRALRQILTNLVDNAVKYSKANLITVRCQQENGKLVLSVKDDGIGISKQELDKLHQEHYRGNSASDHHATGMGIGLWLVDNFAKMHGGELIMESIPDKGSSFSVLFPSDRILAQSN